MARITFNFSEKVALVTGGSRGIGRATALLFGQSGAKVVIGDIDPAGNETVETIKRDGGEAIFVKTDVSNEEDVKNLIATAVKTYGGLHCAFNNAGVLPPTVALVEMEESTFDQNVGGRSQRSVSVHEARDHAHAAKRRRRNCEYCVNTAMTKAWFDDPNMNAHFIANTPIGRVSQPSEIAGVVLFLCSDLASFAVGQTFVIDGGYTTH